MIPKFETLQYLVHAENTEHGMESPGSPGLARGNSLAQELCSEAKTSGYCGPIIRTTAKQLNGLTHILGIPLTPDYASDKMCQDHIKEKKRELNPTESGSLAAPVLPSMPELSKAQPSSEPRTPKEKGPLPLSCPIPSLPSHSH